MKIYELKKITNIKYPNLTILSQEDNIKYRNKVLFNCIKHGNYSSRLDHFIEYGCVYCKKEDKKNNQRIQFIKKSNIKHEYKYTYEKLDYINNKKEVIITCIEHGDFKQRPDNHLAGSGCTFCNYKLSNKEFIKKSKKIHKNKYYYNKVKYTGYRNYVTIGCKKHGEFNQLARIHLSGFGCPKCTISISENKISEILSNNNIEFINQYRFKNCKNKTFLPFDFYLKKYNICIEYHGIQHYKPIDFFGGKEKFIYRQIHDKIKKEFCMNNNIKLYTISYKDNIELFLSNIIKDIQCKEKQKM
jgi:hypothetical protein